MKAILFDFFNYFVFFYTSFLAVSFIVMMFLSFISLKLRRSYYDDNYVRKVLSESPYTPGVSVIAPAYNEEKTIIDNVDSMLGLDYPLFEVVIVNDGSRDSTLDKLIEHYELVEVPFAYIERIKTQPFRRVLKSTNPEYHRLIVVDKENGGTKADASNAGINAAQYPYFICTDVDCILRRDALYRCIWPVLSSSKHVIAVSGTMRMANGCKIENGQVVEVRPPHTPIPLFQNLEYMRSYLVGKMGWSAINAMPNVSGGSGFSTVRSPSRQAVTTRCRSPRTWTCWPAWWVTCATSRAPTRSCRSPRPAAGPRGLRTSWCSTASVRAGVAGCSRR